MGVQGAPPPLLTCLLLSRTRAGAPAPAHGEPPTRAHKVAPAPAQIARQPKRRAPRLPARPQIKPVREDGNFLLCTLLLGNTLVNALIAILSASFTSGTSNPKLVFPPRFVRRALLTPQVNPGPRYRCGEST